MGRALKSERCKQVLQTLCRILCRAWPARPLHVSIPSILYPLWLLRDVPRLTQTLPIAILKLKHAGFLVIPLVVVVSAVAGKGLLGCRISAGAVA
jgi:hypothetical protein